MLRVVYLNCHQVPSGWNHHEVLARWPTLLEVPLALGRAGLQVDVVQAAPRADVMVREGVTFHFTPGGPKTLADAVARCRPDVVHHQSFRFPVHARLLHRRLPQVPLLVQDHGGRAPRSWRRFVAAWGARHIAGAAFTVREQARAYVRRGVLREGVPVFEVLESSSRFTPGEQASAQDVTGLAGDPCFLWVGRLNANKDPLTVLTALERAHPQLPDPHLWMCYTDASLLGATQEWLRARPELATRVHLIGTVNHERIELLCRAADFLVLGSHAEGSGYAVLEALACGTTPLVTDIPSFRRLTGGGEVGALSPPGDAEAMARAMVDWSGRDRARLRQRARAHFERALSFSVVAADLRAAYERLVVQR